MLETEGQVAVTDTETEPVTTDTPKSYIEQDGTFKEGWTNLLDEDIRGEKSLSTHKSLKTLAKTFVNAQRMIGKDKIAIPNEKSSQSEWDEYYKIGGRPETALDYKLDYPKDMPVPEDAALKKTFMEFAYKSGMSQKQTVGAYCFYNNLVKQSVVQQEQQQEQLMKDTMGKLATDWGSAYDQKFHLGNLAIEEGVGGNEELKQNIISKFGNDPDFIRFAANLGNKFSEGKPPNWPNIPTPSDIQTNINELMQKPEYMNRDAIGHKEIVEKVQRLFAEKAKNQNR